MSLIQTIRKHCARDTAVYWGSPTLDVYNKPTYPEPIEIGCFWVESIKTVKDTEGKEVVSEARVYVLQDLAQDGVLWHGALADLLDSDSDYPAPRDVDDSYKIIMFQKTPSLVKTGDFVRTAFI